MSEEANTTRNKEATNLVITGPTTIEGSQIDQMTHVDTVENLIIPDVNKMDNANIQNMTVSERSNIEINNATIQQVIVNEIHQNPVRLTFNEEAFTKYLKEMEISFGDISGGEDILATIEMLHNLPAIVKVSLDKERMKTMGAKRCTDLYDLFPGGIPMKLLIGFLGEPGSGKSVLLKLIQLQCIQSGQFPFFFPVKYLNGKEDTKFARFVRDHGTDFPIKDEELESFGEWLTEKSQRIVYLFDGLDEASISLSADTRAVNVEGSASPQVWMGLLFGKTIMKDSVVVLTSRPASVFKLPLKQRPRLVYSLDGFESGSMKSVVNTYNKENSDEIVNFINKNASKENSFLRSPLAIALIASTYKKSSDKSIDGSSITELYKNAFDERHHSVHNRLSNLQTPDENIRLQDRIDDRIDSFYLLRFKEDQLNAFSAADLKKVGLTTAEVENRSFVRVFCKRNRHLIDDKETMIEPSHLSVIEFHCARALVKNNVENFKDAVNKLFVLEGQDRKTLTRRFLCGLISSPDSDTEKREFFLKKLTTELHMFMSENLARKYKGYKLIQALKLQGHLLNDLTELPKEMIAEVKKRFSVYSNLRIRVELQDSTLLKGVINFNNKVDPQTRLLEVTLHEDVQADELSKFVNAAVNLSKKVYYMRIYDIRSFDIGVMKKLVGHVERVLLLRHKDEVDPDKIDELRTTLQQELDRHKSIKMIVELVHRGRRELLRHNLYTSPSSPLILPSYMGENRNTINLSTELSANDQQSLTGCFDFTVSQVNEIKNLSNVFMTTPSIDIGTLNLYLSSGIDERMLNQFCKKLCKTNNKVVGNRWYNIDESHLDFADIPHIMQHTTYTLELYFTYDISESCKNQLEGHIDSVHKSETPDLYVRLQFKNDDIRFLPCPSTSTSQHSPPRPSTSTSQHSPPRPSTSTSQRTPRRKRDNCCIIS